MLRNRLLQRRPSILSSPLFQNCKTLFIICSYLVLVQTRDFINKLAIGTEFAHNGHNVIPGAGLSPADEARVLDIRVQYCCDVEYSAVFDVVLYS